MKNLGVAAILLFCLGRVLAQGEYTGRYLYGQTNDSDSGGIRLTLGAESPALQIAIAVGQRSQMPYAGTIAGHTVTFAHLPIDKYDLVLVSDTAFWEGVKLVSAPDAAAAKEYHDDVQAEVMKIEGFFDRKEIHRMEVEGTLAGTLVQQWREGRALKQSGAKVKGVIHSLDLIWFERPLKGWQLVKRRQIYREELAIKGPLAHEFVDALSNIRVIKSVKDLGSVDLPKPAEPKAP